MQIYALIIQLIPAWLLMILAALVAVVLQMDITAFTINLFPPWALSVAAFFAAMGWVYWFLRGKTIVILRGFALAFALPLFYYALFDFLAGYSDLDTTELIAISRTARALYYTITIVFHILAFRWRHVTDDHR